MSDDEENETVDLETVAGVDDPKTINERAARGMVRARQALGIHSRAQFARLMKEHMGEQEGRARSLEDSLIGWEQGAHRIPMWAMVVASQVSGLSLDELMEMPPSPRALQLETDLNDVKRVLARLVAEQEESKDQKSTA